MHNEGITSLPFSWWIYAVLGLLLGFGTAQDAARRLSDASGAALLGDVLLLAAGLVILIGAAVVSVVKFRARPHSA